MPNIQNLEVMCAKDHMEVQLSFDKPFTGLVFSKGQFGHDNCVYVQPRSGRNNFRFSIIYNGCGTKPDAKGKFYENTVVVQYDEELIEVWDEAKRLRCEWYNDYEKTATKPPMVIADLEVVELNFRGIFYFYFRWYWPMGYPRSSWQNRAKPTRQDRGIFFQRSWLIDWSWFGWSKWVKSTGQDRRNIFLPFY